MTTCSSRPGITIMVYKTKAIQANLGIFMHILAYSSIFRLDQAYSGIIQVYSRPWVNLSYSEPRNIQNQRGIQNPGIMRILVYSERGGIFRTLVHSEPWDIENQGIFRTLACWESKAYSEPFQTCYHGTFCENSSQL